MATYRYFSAEPNRVAPRYGTGSFIGAVKKQGGFAVDSEMIVPIPIMEVRANLSSYNGMLRSTPRQGPCLRERTREEYVAYAKKCGFEPVPDDAHPTRQRGRISLDDGDFMDVTDVMLEAQSETSDETPKKSRKRKTKSEKAAAEMFGEDGGEE